MQLILASSSPARQQLLQRLQLEFVTISPDIDETPLPAESPTALVKRLAVAKAKAIAADYPQALIIGSDQVAVLQGEIIGKPHSHARAVQQLQQASGQMVRHYTGLCLLNNTTSQLQVTVETYDVHFKTLSLAQIEHYLAKDNPYQCAGAIKAEGLGIALFESLNGRDITSLIGLPLIALCEMLTAAGYPVL